MLISLENFNIKKKSGFIALEGVNGAGKTTVKKHIVSRLTETKLDYIETFEPGDTPVGKSIREILLGKNRDIQNSQCELFLFAADRAEHVERVIKPAISANKIVVCDRYSYSTLAFQGYGRGLDKAIINQLNQIATAGLYPELVILLDLDPEIGLARNKKSSGPDNSFSVDALEKEEIEFHKKIRQGFLEIAFESKETFVKIDTSKSKEQVLSEIDLILKKYLLF